MPLIPQQTDAQRANALSPTPVNVTTPSNSGLFRATGNLGDTVYKQNPDGTLTSYSLSSLGQGGSYGAQFGQMTGGLKSQYGIDYSSLPEINLGDLYQQMAKKGLGFNDANGSYHAPTSNGNLSDLQQPTAPLATSSTTINNTPNKLGDIAGATAAQTQQLAGDQGMNVTQTTTPEGVAAVQKTPLSTPAAQTQTNTGTSTQAPSTAGAAAGAPINYAKSATETIDQYNARIAASGGPSAPTGTTTGATGTIDTNYQMKPGETIDSYNARIAAYNAQKPTTVVSGQVGSSGTMAEKQANTGAPDPYAGLDPVAKQVAMYSEAYKSLGLSTIKDQFDQYAKQQADLTDEMNQKIQDTQNNPWLSQGVSDRTVQRIKDSYATKLDTLTHLLTLTDSLYKQGQAQVDTMVSAANADIKATNDLAQKQIDAANALAKDNSVHSELVNGVPHDLLINNETGKTVADLGPSASTASSGFSLSAGQTRFDANGSPIASVAAKPAAGSGTGGASSDPVVQSWVQNIANGNATLTNVPAALKNAVSLALTNAPADIYSPLAASRFTVASNRITSNFIDLPQFQLTANGLPYLQRIDAAMQNPGSVSDQDLLDSLTKLNSAGNAISDAQVRIITDGKSLADTVNVALNKLSTGGVLSSSQRTQIQTIAKAIYANYAKGYQPVYDQVTSQLTAAGIPKAFWTIPDLNNLAQQGGYGSSAGSANLSAGTTPDIANLASQYGI